MTFETVSADGSIKSEKIFKEIDESTTSYTYRSPTGLLSATQFTQPALDTHGERPVPSRTCVHQGSWFNVTAAFAGHSLGEYSALAALAEVMPIESLVSVVFYRGLTMQVAVERDAAGPIQLLHVCCQSQQNLQDIQRSRPCNMLSRILVRANWDGLA